MAPKAARKRRGGQGGRRGGRKIAPASPPVHRPSKAEREAAQAAEKLRLTRLKKRRAAAAKARREHEAALVHRRAREKARRARLREAERLHELALEKRRAEAAVRRAGKARAKAAEKASANELIQGTPKPARENAQLHATKKKQKKPAKKAAKKPVKKPVTKKPVKKKPAKKKPTKKVIHKIEKVEVERPKPAVKKPIKKKPVKKKPVKPPTKPVKKKPVKPPVVPPVVPPPVVTPPPPVEVEKTAEEILQEAYGHGIEKGEIHQVKNELIRSIDATGTRFEKSFRARLTNSELLENLDDWEEKLVGGALELNDFVHNLSYAVKNQLVPRFHCTWEFIGETRTMKHGSPKKFFTKGKGSSAIEVAVAYDGFGPVKLEQFRRILREKLIAHANSTPTLITAFHVGATIRLPKRGGRGRRRPTE